MPEWKSLRLEALTENDSPITYGVIKPGPEGDILFIRGGDLNFGRVRTEQLRTISSKVSDQYKRTVLRGGELLISLVGTPGQVAIVPQSLSGANIARQVGLIRLTPDINKQYVCYFLQSPPGLDALGAETSGSVQLVINLGALRTVQIPCPPLPEQKRIVALLDSAIANIDKARANAEQNLKNARELFESYLQKLLSQKDAGWEKISLGKATGGIYTGPFGSLLHKSDYIENGIPLVNPAHINSGGITPDNRKTVSQETAQRLSSYIMREGDIVIARRGEMGRCALISKAENGFLCGTGSFYIKSSARCYGDYLVRYLRSATCKARLEKIAGGAVMPNLSNTDLSNLSIYLPPINVQKEITESIEELSSRTNGVAAVYQKKIEALDELKKSLLHKAFTSQLSASATKTATDGQAA